MSIYKGRENQSCRIFHMDFDKGPRLLKRSSDERLLKYAGKRVRYALIVVDLVNRRPIEVVRDEFAYLDFDEEGRFKEPEHEKEESSALDMLDFFSLEQQDKRVIDARHKFARKRYFDKNRWEPTDEIVAVRLLCSLKFTDDASINRNLNS